VGLAVSLLASAPSVVAQPQYGACDEITFGIAPAGSGSDYEPAERIIQCILERIELNGGGDVYPNIADMQDTLAETASWQEEKERIRAWLQANPVQRLKTARYQLAIFTAPTPQGEQIIAEIRNVETCELLIRETVQVLGSMRSRNIVQATERLWQALTDRSPGPGAGAGKAGGHYVTISERLRAELMPAKSHSYDYSALPRYHPVSPALARFSHRVEHNGQVVNEEYRPGDVLDIVASYKDCDGIPIRNLPVAFTVVAGEASLVPTGIKQAANFQTDERGSVLFRVWTNPDTEPSAELRLRLRSESSCASKTLFDQDILLHAMRPTRKLEQNEAKLKGTFNVSGAHSFSRFTLKGRLTIKFEATWRKRAQLVRDWPGPKYYNIIGQGAATQDISVSARAGCSITDEFLPREIPVTVLGWPSRDIENLYELHFYSTQRSSMLGPGKWIGYGPDPGMLWKVYAKCKAVGQDVEFHPFLIGSQIRLEDGTYTGRSSYVTPGDEDKDPYSMTLTLEYR
jgi:hypothetical protein